MYYFCQNLYIMEWSLTEKHNLKWNLCSAFLGIKNYSSNKHAPFTLFPAINIKFLLHKYKTEDYKLSIFALSAQQFPKITFENPPVRPIISTLYHNTGEMIFQSWVFMRKKAASQQGGGGGWAMQVEETPNWLTPYVWLTYLVCASGIFTLSTLA